MFHFSEATGYVDDGEPMDGADYYDDIKEEDSFEEEAPRQKPKSSRKSTKGRMLKRWDADEDQLLLLFCDYVCTMQGCPMPWDAIAATMEPRDPASGKLPMTGEAIKQHLAKLRLHRGKAGLRVPPALDRTARRQAVSSFARVTGGNAMQTPAATPRKVAGSFNVPAAGKARVKQQSETPTKQSTLLANVNKTKQKKAEQAKRAQMGNAFGFAAAARNIVGGVKANAGKRGRMPKSADEDYRDEHGISDPAPTRKLRPIEYKDYALPEIKAEEDSDDDLPLSKKVDRKTRPGVGLMNDTVAMWNNRENDQAHHAHAATKKKATHNAGMQTGKFGDTSTTEAGKQQQQRQQVATGRAQNSNTNTNSDYPAHHTFGAMAPTSYEQPTHQFDYGMGGSAPNQFRYVFGQQHEHGGGSSGFAGNQIPANLNHMTHPTDDFDVQLTSSPAHDSNLSSNSFYSAGFNPAYNSAHGTAVSQPSSGDTSMTSSLSSDFSNDPFGMPSTYSNTSLGGLPSASTDSGMSHWGGTSYTSHAPTPAATTSATQGYFDHPNNKAMQNYQSQTPSVAGWDAPVHRPATANTASPAEDDHSLSSMINGDLDASLPSMVHRFDAGATPKLTQPTTPNQAALTSTHSLIPAVDSADFGPGTHNTGHHSPDFSQFLNNMNDPYGAGMFGDGISQQGFSTEESGHLGS